ncbi:hypothetical protein R1sor_020553 [Riccia sorocarpa]|uniref:Uncharacterized protein n=1 Tax=Riccia sorocarpa TaxID=122646 RepID=A0ABD3IGF5_9MARC
MLRLTGLSVWCKLDFDTRLVRHFAEVASVQIRLKQAVVVDRSQLMVSNSPSSIDAHVMEDDEYKWTPKYAADSVQRLIGLNDEQRTILENHLNEDDEDALLVLRVNPEWIAIHGQAAADGVTDDIARYLVGEQRRRDKAGKRWIFHFELSSDIDKCKSFVLATHPQAFSLSPEAVAAGFVGANTIPLAFAAVVHKVGVRQDDAARSGFFYL